ncbi:hypothetical protein [Sphingomonas bacterium]|uniref:hypothetical protein n=1 Tax=Sphingomonas bacterium TaxID=1895847 RepID=UPI0015766E78|nr:hypothetical protein [Sphingomonas bacterium]
MLRIASTEPEWLELFPAVGEEPAVEVRFAPITVPAVRAARRAVRVALDLDAEDMENAGDELSRELIRRGLLEWRGVGGLDGQPWDVTPEHVAAFVGDHRTFEAADRVYVIPWLKRDTEGNAWSASPSGTGEAETRAAGTASSAAEQESTDGADPAKTAPAAPTARTSRKPKKA